MLHVFLFTLFGTRRKTILDTKIDKALYIYKIKFKTYGNECIAKVVLLFFVYKHLTCITDVFEAFSID